MLELVSLNGNVVSGDTVGVTTTYTCGNTNDVTPANGSYTVTCSSGTYMRSLFYDIAKAVNVAGHMSKLNRVRLANIAIENCVTIDNLAKDPLDHFIKPIDVLESLIPRHELTAQEFDQLKIGNKIIIDENAEYVAMIYDGDVKFVAKNINGEYKSQTNLE